MPGKLDLTPQQLGLLATGLGMMQNSRGRSTGEAFGAGGMQGLNAMYQAQQMQQRQALAEAQQNRYNLIMQREQQQIDRSNQARELVKNIDPNDRDAVFKAWSSVDPVGALQYAKSMVGTPSFERQVGPNGELYTFDSRTGNLSRAMIDGKQAHAGNLDPYTTGANAAARENSKIFKTQTYDGRDKFITGREATGKGVTRDQILALIPGLIMTESGGNPNAVSPKGAQGITQWMPKSASDPGYGVEPFDINNTTPQQQVEKTRQYLEGIAAENPGWNIDQVISSYNMGPGKTEKGMINNDYVDKVKNHPFNLRPEEQGFGPSIYEKEKIEQQAKAEGAALKLQEENKQKAIIDLPAYIDESNNLLSIIDKTINHKGLSDVVGIPSMLTYMPGMGAFPGSNAAGVMELLKQIKGKSFLQAFERLKGGGGHITDIEGQKATDSIARLNTAQSEEEFISALEEFKSIITQGMNRAYEKAGKEYTQPGNNNGFDGFTIERIQ